MATHEDETPGSIYTSLTSSDNHIRLLKFLPESTPDNLSCSLEEYRRSADEDSSYTYKALSYCWGDPTAKKAILVNNCPFQITNNLWLALASISQYHDNDKSLYWIDAICINQTDLEEKNEQVHKMWRTFSGAKMVYAWLGPRNERIILDLDVMRHDPRPTPWALLQCEYFSRSWIIPEFLQAREVMLLCGEYSIDYSELDKPLSNAPSTMWRRSDLPTKPYLATQREGMFDLLRYIAGSYWPSLCTDNKDKIFALLSDPEIRAADSDGWMKPDYTLNLLELIVLCVAWCDHVDRTFFLDQRQKIQKFTPMDYNDKRLKYHYQTSFPSLFMQHNLGLEPSRQASQELPYHLEDFRSRLRGRLKWRSGDDDRYIITLGHRDIVVGKTEKSWTRLLLGDLLP